MTLTFATLGPSGSCHELATQKYIEFQGLGKAKLHFVMDFREALELLRTDEVDFVVQGCAHPQVCEMLETHYHEVFMIDSFLFPTKDLAVLTRREVVEPRTLGLMPVTSNYVDINRWPRHIHEKSNPIVAQRFLEGAYDSAITFAELAERFPKRFVVEQRIGHINMAWLVYGKAPRGNGEVICLRDHKLFASPGGCGNGVPETANT